MPTDLPEVTPAEIEAAIDLLCSRGWSPPNAHGFATDIRDAIIAARRRAPPLAAPAPSAMATGEDEIARVREAWIVARQVVFAVRAVLEAFGERDEPHIDDHQSAALRDLRETATAYYQRNHDRSTPPAAPAAVTEAARALVTATTGRLPADSSDSVSIEAIHVRRLAAALAAAASAATKGE